MNSKNLLQWWISDSVVTSHPAPRRIRWPRPDVSQRTRRLSVSLWCWLTRTIQLVPQMCTSLNLLPALFNANQPTGVALKHFSHKEQTVQTSIMNGRVHGSLINSVLKGFSIVQLSSISGDINVQLKLKEFSIIQLSSIFGDKYMYSGVSLTVSRPH